MDTLQDPAYIVLVIGLLLSGGVAFYCLGYLHGKEARR